MIKYRLLIGIMLSTITFSVIAFDSEWSKQFENIKQSKWDGLRKAATIEDLNLFISKEKKYDLKTTWGQLQA